MNIFNIFKKKEGPFETLYKTIEININSGKIDTKIESEILNWNDDQKVLLIIDIIKNINNLKEKINVLSRRRFTFYFLSTFFAKRKITLGKYSIIILNTILEELKCIVNNKNNIYRDYNDNLIHVIKPILTNILRFHNFENKEEKDIINKIKSELAVFKQTHFYYDINKIIQKVEDILYEENGENISKPTYFIGDDEFKNYANTKIESLKESQKQMCFKILSLAQNVSGSKPSKKYLDDSRILIESFGNEDFKIFSQELFKFIIGLKEKTKFYTSNHNGGVHTYAKVEFLNPLNIDILKGLVWMNSKFYDNKTILTISKLAERCFKKTPEKGSASSSLGNACLYTLYASKGLDGIAQLSKLKLKIKQNTTQDLIEKYIIEAANKLGVSSMEVEDLAVDDFKISDNKFETYFEDIKAVIELTGIGKSIIRWYKEDGKEQKTVPQSIKDKFSIKLNKLKDKQKQIDQTTSVQKERFDRMLRSNRVLSLEYLNEKYIKHGLISFVINKVIFKFSNDKESKLAIFINRKWIDIHFKEIELHNFINVELWHPATSSTQEVKEWRQFLMDSEIQQPFKQAYREIYILTDAEINTKIYSNRMASHILKQHQYVTLAKGRNWKAKLIGSWDGGDQDTAQLNLPEFKIKVEFWVNSLNVENQWNSTGIWNYVTTDQIRFLNSETNELIDLINVPTIAFSEAMRDVDLFVGVASVGNDPTWSDSGGLPTYRDYWQSYSFGELSEVAKNRKEILQSLVPRLNIADVTHISDKFLIVKGKIRTYKIHFGSTNILMEPNDQYLCIVADRGKKNETENIFLPFEGDIGLSLIISKALLLANDDKIKDTTITSQINR
ncbi:MAG: DUF4132 domain-containing protein [Saprospiraceae bacterium]|nr:DUF4132 domain-containing protein [Saprospiraceae bacterium]